LHARLLARAGDPGAGAGIDDHRASVVAAGPYVPAGPGGGTREVDPRAPIEGCDDALETGTSFTVYGDAEAIVPTATHAAKRQPGATPDEDAALVGVVGRAAGHLALRLAAEA
jgi:hypothetical protein